MLRGHGDLVPALLSLKALINLYCPISLPNGRVPLAIREAKEYPR
jgi:hypothetical protein